MQERIKAIAARYPGVDVGSIEEMIRSGEAYGLSPDACLVGIRLALAMEHGREELFSLDDVAAALGCTREEAAAEVERQNISTVKVSTLPGLEWLLDG